MFNYFYKIFPYKPTILSFWGTPIYGNPHMLCQQLSPAFLSVSPIVFPIAGRSLLDDAEGILQNVRKMSLVRPVGILLLLGTV